MARVAVVTGGTRGIGHAISIALKNQGYRVAANYAGNDAAAQQFQAETGIPVYKWDVGNFEACGAGLAQVAKDLGPVDILVNSHGVSPNVPLLEMDLATYQSPFVVNAQGCFLTCRAAARQMVARGARV